jgi:peroxin-1
MDCGADVEWEAIAQETVNWTGADLQALLSNAQLEAIHDMIDDHSDDADLELVESVVELDYVHLNASVEDKAELTKRLVIMTGRTPLTAEASHRRPVVTADHVDLALSQFRPSLTPSERARHDRIRQQFLSGRSPSASSAGEHVTIA